MTHPDRYPPDPTPERGHSGAVVSAVALVAFFVVLIALVIVVVGS